MSDPLSNSFFIQSSLNLSKGTLSSDVFEPDTSTGSEPCSLLIWLNTTKFVLLSVLTLRWFPQEFVETHGQRVQKVHFRLKYVTSKRSFLKLPKDGQGSASTKSWWISRLYLYNLGEPYTYLVVVRLRTLWSSSFPSRLTQAYNQKNKIEKGYSKGRKGNWWLEKNISWIDVQLFGRHPVR